MWPTMHSSSPSCLFVDAPGDLTGDWEAAEDRAQAAPRQQADKTFTVGRQLALQAIAHDQLQMVIPTVLRLLHLGLSRLASPTRVRPIPCILTTAILL